jgi:hypothetical protein
MTRFSAYILLSTNCPQEDEYGTFRGGVGLRTLVVQIRAGLCVDDDISFLALYLTWVSASFVHVTRPS